MECPRCPGLVIRQADMFGRYQSCLSCGWNDNSAVPTEVGVQYMDDLLRQTPGALYYSFTENIGQRVKKHIPGEGLHV